jgi:lipopolysaccharide transport system permease protein
MNRNTSQLKGWDWQIGAQSSWWDFSLKELWKYRHLLARLVRREFLLHYQQTILGPAWILLQPVLTLGIYLLVFREIIGIPTGSAPPMLFYLSGIILWNFFSETFSATAFTFTNNAQLFGKVYFPRLIMPLSQMLTHGIRFGIQFFLLALLWLYYRLYHQLPLPLTGWVVLIPGIVLLVGIMGFSVGTVFSVFTARYRDLSNIVHLGIRLLMFITPVLYPYAVIPEKLKWVAGINPLVAPFELFRFSVLGEGSVQMMPLVYSGTFAVLVLAAALSLFSRQSNRLMDVI